MGGQPSLRRTSMAKISSRPLGSSGFQAFLKADFCLPQGLLPQGVPIVSNS